LYKTRHSYGKHDLSKCTVYIHELQDSTILRYQFFPKVVYAFMQFNQVLCIHTHTHTHTHTHIYIYIYIYMYIYTHMYVYICMYVYSIYVCM
jgi:hypothetical protein